MILWFKHDLRTHDHPGLSKALATSRPVIAFFCFDPATLSDQATTLWGPQAVRGAVSRLQERMEELRIPMVIRTGDTVSNLLQVVDASGAEIVSCESEVECRWVRLQTEVDQGASPLTSQSDSAIRLPRPSSRAGLGSSNPSIRTHALCHPAARTRGRHPHFDVPVGHRHGIPCTDPGSQMCLSTLQAFRRLRP